MIVITTSGTLLFESLSEKSVKVSAFDRAPLEVVIEQLELFGQHDDPPQLEYSTTDIVKANTPLSDPFPYSLKMDRRDAALFLQSELLNFLGYRRFGAQIDYLDVPGEVAVHAIVDWAN